MWMSSQQIVDCDAFEEIAARRVDVHMNLAVANRAKPCCNTLGCYAAAAPRIFTDHVEDGDCCGRRIAGHDAGIPFADSVGIGLKGADRWKTLSHDLRQLAKAHCHSPVVRVRVEARPALPCPAPATRAPRSRPSRADDRPIR